MGDGARLAMAIAILFAAMIAFFFAFHPGGVMSNGQPITSGSDILNWLFGTFDKASADPTATQNSAPKPTTPGASPDTTNPTNPANNPKAPPQAVIGARNGT